MKKLALNLSALILAATSAAADPDFSVPIATLAEALRCPGAFIHLDKNPVLLVHGTALTYEENLMWNFGTTLPAAGFDVCGVQLPQFALGDIQIAAEYVVYALKFMNGATGRHVAVLGHSQGGNEIRWAMKWWTSLQTIVDDVILLASPYNGTAVGNVVCVTGSCSPAGKQLAYGSNFNFYLNNNTGTPGQPNVAYTNIYSLNDELAVYPTAVLPGADVNILLQSICPLSVVTHFGLVYAGLPYLLTLDALSNPGPADPSRLPSNKCSQTFQPGLNAIQIALYTALFSSQFALRIAAAPQVTSEPAIAAYAL